MYKLDVNSTIPIYLQIEQQTVEYIMLDLFYPHQLLPSVRNLSQQLGINPNTVQRAYQELEEQGYIYFVSGKGSYVAESNSLKEQFYTKQLQALQIQIQKLLHYNVTPERIMSAVCAAIKEDPYDNHQPSE